MAQFSDPESLRDFRETGPWSSSFFNPQFKYVISIYLHSFVCCLVRYSSSYLQHALQVFDVNATELKANVGRMFVFYPAHLCENIYIFCFSLNRNSNPVCKKGFWVFFYKLFVFHFLQFPFKRFVKWSNLRFFDGIMFSLYLRNCKFCPQKTKYFWST